MPVQGFRIKLTEHEYNMMVDSVLFSEHLRYAGCVQRPDNRVQAIGLGWWLDVYPPKGVSNVKQWAENNCNRLASFQCETQLIIRN